MPPSNENVKRIAIILAREQVASILASIRRVAEKGSSRETGFRYTSFSATGLPVYGVLGNQIAAGRIPVTLQPA
jgi:hypothetical protein